MQKMGTVADKAAPRQWRYSDKNGRLERTAIIRSSPRRAEAERYMIEFEGMTRSFTFRLVRPHEFEDALQVAKLAVYSTRLTSDYDGFPFKQVETAVWRYIRKDRRLGFAGVLDDSSDKTKRLQVRHPVSLAEPGPFGRGTLSDSIGSDRPDDPRRELRESVARALDTLTPVERQVISLVFEQGMEKRAVGHLVFGKDTGSVSNFKRRALDKIRNVLTADGWADEFKQDDGFRAGPWLDEAMALFAGKVAGLDVLEARATARSIIRTGKGHPAEAVVAAWLGLTDQEFLDRAAAFVAQDRRAREAVAELPGGMNDLVEHLADQFPTTAQIIVLRFQYGFEWKTISRLYGLTPQAAQGRYQIVLRELPRTRLHQAEAHRSAKRHAGISP